MGLLIAYAKRSWMMYDDRLTNPELLQFSMQHFELVFDTKHPLCIIIIFTIILEKLYTFDRYSDLSKFIIYRQIYMINMLVNMMNFHTQTFSSSLK